MNVHPILHVIFEIISSGFIQILNNYLVSWKISPLYLFSSELLDFEQKDPIDLKFLDF